MAMLTVVVKNADESFVRDLPSAPESVVFNPDDSVLAVVKNVSR